MDYTPSKRPPPSEPMRLMMAGFMAFIKGGIGAAIVVAPFFGIAAALASTMAFTLFCVWLARRSIGRSSVDHATATGTTTEQPFGELK